MKKTVFTGAAVAIITPMLPDGSIHYEELGRIIEDQIAGGTDAVVICGTTGEASTMPDEEHLDCIEYAVKKVAGRVPVVAGTGSNDTVHAIKLSQEAERRGVDALLQVTPYYNKTSQSGLVRHFTAIADAVNVPIILYNVPSRTGVNITPATCKILSQHPRIVAIKEASGNIAQVAQIAHLCGDDLAIYSGIDDQIVPLLALGAKGGVSVLSNVAPRQTHDICRLWFEGDTKASLQLQLDMMELCGALFCDVNPIPVKAAMNMLGYQAGECRLPLDRLSPEHMATLRAALQKAGLLD